MSYLSKESFVHHWLQHVLKKGKKEKENTPHEIILFPRNDKKANLKVSTPNLYRGEAYLELTPCNVHCKTPGYQKKILKQKEKWGLNQISIMKIVKNSDFWIFLAVWRLLGSLGPACSSVQWEFRQSGNPIRLAKTPFLATHLPVSQDSSFPPDSTGCWPGSLRTAHGEERPSDTKPRHWRGNCNVREGIWKIQVGINHSLQAVRLCMAEFKFQLFEAQLMSRNKERTCV